jgi:uncharacterized small protein (DUF1192 family)
MRFPVDKTTVAHPDPREERLAEMEERHRHDLMDYEQRCELWSRIAAARAEIAKAKAERA